MKKITLAFALAFAAAGALPAHAGTTAYSGSILAEDATVDFKVVKKKGGKKKIKGIVVEDAAAECEGEEEPVLLYLAPGGSYKVKQNAFKVRATEPFVYTMKFDGTLEKGGEALGTLEFFGTVGGFGEPEDQRYCEVSERFWSAKK
jgi:hypothetical protein